jgi:ATP-binding cassette subfamily B protein
MRISLQQYWALLVDYLRPQRARVLGLALLLFANIGLQLVNPQIMRRFIDAALSGEDTSRLTVLALWFIAIALVQQFAAVGATYVGENVAWIATNWLRYDLARHCLYLDMSFHNERSPGEMIERIDGDVNALSNFFSQFTLQVLGNAILLLGVLTLLFREDVRVGLALTAFVGLSLTAINLLRNSAVPYWRDAREVSADFFGFLEERLAGIEDIRTSGAKAYVMRRFFELLRTFWRTTVKARLMAFAIVNVTWTLFSVGTAVAFIVGANLYQLGDLTLGSVYLIVHYTGMLSRPIERISEEIERLQEAGAGVARIQELLQIENRLNSPPLKSAMRRDGHRAATQVHLHPKPGTWRATGSALPDGALAVSFENVSFAYAPKAPEPAEDLAPRGDTRTAVLRDVSFRLEAGRVLGLLGRTGSGKTTVTRLLFRLYDPLEGRVFLADRDLRELPLYHLRQHVGIVTQNVQLFNASVRDNLTFFDPNVPDGDILSVMQELGLTRWYESLPAGLNTVLAAGGSDLSAGEAQLLAFTRIFLKDPGLVILDEASSRLDPATEGLIERAVARLLQDRTGIVIAHRLATVGRADEILILDGGRVQECGPRAVLARDTGSRFYQLLHTGLEEMLA